MKVATALKESWIKCKSAALEIDPTYKFPSLMEWLKKAYDKYIELNRFFAHEPLSFGKWLTSEVNN